MDISNAKHKELALSITDYLIGAADDSLRHPLLETGLLDWGFEQGAKESFQYLKDKIALTNDADFNWMEDFAIWLTEDFYGVRYGIDDLFLMDCWYRNSDNEELKSVLRETYGNQLNLDDLISDKESEPGDDYDNDAEYILSRIQDWRESWAVASSISFTDFTYEDYKSSFQAEFREDLADLEAKHDQLYDDLEHEFLGGGEHHTEEEREAFDAKVDELFAREWGDWDFSSPTTLKYDVFDNEYDLYKSIEFLKDYNKIFTFDEKFAEEFLSDLALEIDASGTSFTDVYRATSNEEEYDPV